MVNFNKYIISISTTIRDAVKKMDKTETQSLIVLENEKVAGVFTMGDFRRAVLNGLDINNEILSIINRDYKYVDTNYTQQELREIFLNNPMIIDVPVLDTQKKLVNVINRDDYKNLFEDELITRGIAHASVVIMAGGKGTRMDPFTRILPKPLIPIGDKPIIQVIMDGFKNYGVDDFYISINEKGEMIKAYFHDHDLPYGIKYIEEDKPRGTAGSLIKLDGIFKEPFFLSNCDIIIKSDYRSIWNFHLTGKYDLTLVASMRHYKIPYGICELDNKGRLNEIKEKPEYDFLVNTGLYVINPDILNLIPENDYFDMTDLIECLQKEGYNIGVFPVSEKSWVDVGQWTEYKKALDELVSKDIN